MQDAVLHRGQWSLCAMEHSLIGAVHLTDPGAPFHHFGLCVGGAPVRAGMSGDGRPLGAVLTRGDMAVIEAGVGGTSWWDTPFESACFYFTDASLAVALGRNVEPGGHLVRSAMGFRSVSGGCSKHFRPMLQQANRMVRWWAMPCLLQSRLHW